MQSSGVMPIPPASRRLSAAPWASGKWFLGGLMLSSSPTRTDSCIASDPPRLAGSFKTAIWYLCDSPESLQSEYWR